MHIDMHIELSRSFSSRIAAIAAIVASHALLAPLAPADDCPAVVEVVEAIPECGIVDQNPADDPSVLVICPYQAGQWVLKEKPPKLQPASPILIEGWEPIEVDLGFNAGTWVFLREAVAMPDFCMAHVKGTMNATTFGGAAASETLSEASSYHCSAAVVWQAAEGTNPAYPPKPHQIELMAAGGGGMSITVTVSAAAGATSSASATMTGKCTSRGDASATMHNATIGAQAGFPVGAVGVGQQSMTVLTGNLDIDGSRPLDVSFGLGVHGSMSKKDTWTVQGVGSYSGSATAQVTDCRVYRALTNKPFTMHRSGRSIAAGGCSVSGLMSSGFEARSEVDLHISYQELSQ